MQPLPSDLEAVKSLYKEKYGFSDAEDYVFKARKGLDERGVAEISHLKNEAPWLREYRLKALHVFAKKRMPNWGGDLSAIDFNNVYYYIRPSERSEDNWEDVPEYIKNTFDRLGIPEAEKKGLLGGVGAQYESEVVYHSLQEQWTKQGVLFLDPDSALRDHADLFRRWFGKVIPVADNKFAALNSAVFSGGSFIYVPPGVKVTVPLQAYFRINAKNMGQFERTLIIADRGSDVHYVEGCTAPVYSSDSLHSAVVELVALEGAHIRYTTIQNWSNNVYNLVTKRALAHAGAFVEWVDCNLGSKVTMKYPSVYMVGAGARAEILSLAFAADGQHQDAGGKVVHAAPDTRSTIVSKSISKGRGKTTYRGLVKVERGAERAKSHVQCDALLLDPESVSETFPYIENEEDRATLTHEATVSKVGEDQLFYLMSRGLPQVHAMNLIVRGFAESIVKEMPMEYAVEMNRLIEIQMEGAVG
ncbi:MAG: Fe-S cluster assembly protein SufB [Nitrospirae bacterium]|nr:Fe-S cluster assembly protein SufB [Nitrospirota bacterium]